MSYRLINANAIVPSHPEVNDMPCIYADLENGLDGRLYDFREFRRLEEENVKLSELVQDMWTCIGEGEWDCSDCPRYDRCDKGVSEFVRRMRELGLEVDDDD